MRAERRTDAPVGVHITGAAGAGSTTLGHGLAQRLGVSHLDTDDYFWHKTEPPYQRLREAPDRLQLLSEDLDKSGRWVLSGGVMSWGAPLIPRFQLVIFLYVPPEIRIARLAARERQRFGAAIEPGGPMHAHHLEFMEWAAAYDSGAASGRSLKLHRDWLAALPCPVLRLDGLCSPDNLVEQAAQALEI